MLQHICRKWYDQPSCGRCPINNFWKFWKNETFWKTLKTLLYCYYDLYLNRLKIKRPYKNLHLTSNQGSVDQNWSLPDQDRKNGNLGPARTRTENLFSGPEVVRPRERFWAINSGYVPPRSSFFACWLKFLFRTTYKKLGSAELSLIEKFLHGRVLWKFWKWQDKEKMPKPRTGPGSTQFWKSWTVKDWSVRRRAVHRSLLQTMVVEKVSGLK